MTGSSIELSVIIPFRNARAHAAENLRRLHAYLDGLGAAFEILAIDDGSEDGTAGELARAAKELGPVRVLRSTRWLGKGACVAQAMSFSSGERVVFIDGDLAFPLEKIESLVRALDAADLAIVSRRRGFSIWSFFNPRYWLSLLFTGLVRAFLLPDVEDSQAGLKAFRRQAAQLVASRQRCAGFAFDVEALTVARRFGLKIRQVDTSWRQGDPSTVRPLSDGIEMIGDLGAIWYRARSGAYERCERRPWDGALRPLDLSNDAAVAQAGRPAPRWEERAADFIVANPAWLLVPLSSLLIAIWFLPEIMHCSLYMNDGVLHAAVIRRMELAWAGGGDIFDFWLKNISAGHAFIRVSHFLMYLTAFLIHKAMFNAGSVEFAMALTIFLTAVLTPWSIYKGGRLLGFSISASAVAAALFPMIRDTSGFGISLENFSFSGHGLYNEAFAMLSLPITLGLIHRALKRQGGVVPAAISFTVTWMSHLFVGYMATVWMIIDACLVAAGDRKRWAEPLGRALGIGGLFGLFGAGLIVPVLQDRLLQMRSLDEPYYRFMGKGAVHVLRQIFTGLAFDNAKPYPDLTILAVAGLALGWYLVVRRKQRPADNPAALVAVQAVIWIGLTFGPATWGEFLTGIPFARDVHWHRLIGCAQLMLIYGAAHAFTQAWDWLMKGSAPRRLAAPALAAAIFVPGVVVGSRYFLGINEQNLIVTERAWGQDRELHAIVDFAQKHPETRIDPGDYRNFGKNVVLIPGFPLFAILNEFNVQTISMLYHSLSLTSPLNYGLNLADRADMELVNVRWLVLPESMKPPPGLKPVLSGPKAVVYDNGNTEGFFMVGTQAPSRCADNDILYYSIHKWIDGPDQDHGIFPGVRLVDQCPGADSLIDAVDTNAKPSASGRILAAGVDKISGGLSYWARARMDSPGLLVFKMEYHPAWKVSLNGRPARTYMVVPGFTAVRVDHPGDYLIEAHYEPSGLRRWLLLFGALSAFLLGLWSRGRDGGRGGAPQSAEGPTPFARLAAKS